MAKRKSDIGRRTRRAARVRLLRRIKSRNSVAQRRECSFHAGDLGLLQETVEDEEFTFDEDLWKQKIKEEYLHEEENWNQDAVECEPFVYVEVAPKEEETGKDSEVEDEESTFEGELWNQKIKEEYLHEEENWNQDAVGCESFVLVEVAPKEEEIGKGSQGGIDKDNLVSKREDELKFKKEIYFKFLSIVMTNSSEQHFSYSPNLQITGI